MEGGLSFNLRRRLPSAGFGALFATQRISRTRDFFAGGGATVADGLRIRVMTGAPVCGSAQKTNPRWGRGSAFPNGSRTV